MIYWTHDELRQLIDANSELKAKSDKLHALAPTNSLHEFEKRKLQMMQIYAEAVKCKKRTHARTFVKKTMKYIKTQCTSPTEWKKIVPYPRHQRKLTALQKKYRWQKKCFSPNNNDYICYCYRT